MNLPGNPPPEKPSSQDDDEKVLPSEALFQGAKEIVIRHEGQDYRLRVTQQGKLILTK